MRALTFKGKETIHYESIPDPEIQEDTDVIVKVSHCAICGSDLHVYHERETGIDHGTAMGHEFVGEVVEKGKEVKLFSPQDLIMTPFTTSCGSCFYCRKGLTARCIAGQLFGWRENYEGLHGGQAELVRVPLADSTLLRIPEGVSMEEALLIGDIFSTGFFCAENAGVNQESVVAVVGCGPVGQMAIIASIQLGADQIYAFDSIPERLELAADNGAVPLNITDKDCMELLFNATHGRGADCVLEAVGSGSAGTMAYDLVRPGGVISSIGVCTDQQLAFSPVMAYDKNLTYKSGRCPARYYMEKLIPLVQEGKLNLTSIISHRMQLSEGEKAYRIFANRLDNCMKVILEP